jgi:hypothetical protein
MSTQLDRDVSTVLNAVVPRAERKAKLAGRVLAALERSEIARLTRAALRGNVQALESLKIYAGPLPSPAKAAVSTVNEETDLGQALLAGHRGSPFFAETAPRAAEVAEDASIPGATQGIADEIGRMPLINGDAKFHDLTRAWAMKIPFGGRRLDG